MKKVVKVKDVIIGEGVPKICVPLVGCTVKELIEEAIFLKTLDLDVVEWRVDFFEHVEEVEKVREALSEIREILTNIPLLFTFRSKKEGGQKEVSTEFYIKLNTAMIETGQVDIIDVELFNEENTVKTLVEEAHSKGIFVIISNHDFDKTPTKEEIIARLCRAQELGADLPKIAVMPKNTADVFTLLDATHTMNEQFADRPIITMSMAGMGVITRLSGEIFGSALTFGAGKKGSAPGQVAVKELRAVLDILHSNL
ncbi:type I 3-dehydroquinate dehydratase [Neobacillus massiliamazoniensis]|uniref:3-dehydroquinate dehydratase n=1 Tax=Neobacillus massiliamazoniensis TaxID=1499688 RepID=A0A0U1NUP1_9BACI|nr:type I 3-dehydroquinate dehydratase [Neobacillus massiliamazoniensis]CRK81777.1 3-dehydroquinate dehydratase [Neobacillus massiliamazoniensis]